MYDALRLPNTSPASNPIQLKDFSRFLSYASPDALPSPVNFQDTVARSYTA